jgi:hypothetical protein
VLAADGYLFTNHSLSFVSVVRFPSPRRSSARPVSLATFASFCSNLPERRGRKRVLLAEKSEQKEAKATKGKGAGEDRRPPEERPGIRDSSTIESSPRFACPVLVRVQWGETDVTT